MYWLMYRKGLKMVFNMELGKGIYPMHLKTSCTILDSRINLVDMHIFIKTTYIMKLIETLTHNYSLVQNY